MTMAMVPLHLLLLISVFVSLYLYINKTKRSKRGAPSLPPGPKGVPILGNLLQLGARPHQTLQALSKTYGPLLRLRFGCTDVMVASSASVAEHFLKNDSNFCNRPPNSGAEHVAYNYNDLVFAPYGPRWRMLRKLSAMHLLGPKAMDGLKDVRKEELTMLTRTLYARSKEDAAVNVGKEMHICLTNALSRAMMGRRVFEKAAEEEMENAEAFKDLVVELMTVAGVFNIGDFVPWLKPFDVQGVVAKMKMVHGRFDAFLDRIIGEHRSVVKPGAKDLLSVLIRIKGDGDGDSDSDSDGDGGVITDTAIKALLLNLFSAGTDTSSSTAEWALTELIRRPDILKKAQEEIDSVVGRDCLVSESDIQKLPYLQAIVKENFRLHPATPLSLPRMSIKDCEIAGFRIPKNATLLVNIWAIGRDPSIWPNPLEFSPDRFLSGGQGEYMDAKGNNFKLMPFGGGRRICPGAIMAITVVQSLVATLIHAFDWALPTNQTAEMIDMGESSGITLHKLIPLMAHPIPRLNPKAYGLS